MQLSRLLRIIPRNAMSSNLVPENPSADPALSAEELLPPVEPPSAGFILQLFIVPGLIVLTVALLGLLITALATSGAQDPDKIVQALRGSNQARWQQAKELADMLRLPLRYPELRQSIDLAGHLVELLDEEVDAGLADDNSIKLRFFLCRVLGEFDVDVGLGVLLKTAAEDSELDVRRQAINALAVLADSFNTMEEPQALKHEKLVGTFAQLAAEKNDLLRSEAAFALGVFAMHPAADPQLTAELELLADDLFGDARYNAALALARRGNARAAAPLAEMLDPEAIELTIAREEWPSRQTFKRNTILQNALEAIGTLLEKSAPRDRSTLLAAVEQFVASAPQWKVGGDLPEPLVVRGQEILEKYAITSAR